MILVFIAIFHYQPLWASARGGLVMGRGMFNTLYNAHDSLSKLAGLDYDNMPTQEPQYPEYPSYIKAVLP